MLKNNVMLSGKLVFCFFFFFALGLPLIVHGPFPRWRYSLPTIRNHRDSGIPSPWTAIPLSLAPPLKTPGGANNGAVYIFNRNVGGKEERGLIKKLILFDPDPGIFFGVAVAVSGDVAVVGVPGEERYGSADIGAIYIYDLNHGGIDNRGLVKHEFRQLDYDAGDRFGEAVSLKDDVDIAGTDAGAAYVYYRNQGGDDNWGRVKRLTAPEAAASDSLGQAVSVAENSILVGATYHDIGGLSNRGAVYVFAQPFPWLIMYPAFLDADTF
jgi:hypothetical protein